MSTRILILIFISMTLVTACDEDSDSDEASDTAPGTELAVQVESASPDDPNSIFMLGQNDDHHVDFCYADGDCDYWEGTYGGSGIGGSEAGYAIMSEEGREVVGANINLHVSSGAGTVKIVKGSANPESWDSEFTVDKVVESLGSFSEGDSVSFSYGEMQ